MVKVKQVLGVIIIVALLLSSGLPFGEQPAAAADGEELDLPPIELPDKGNPKLDSQLNQLVSAQTPKRAASFAQESNIELVDGNVRVIVECLPGQVDAAAKTAGALGVVETSYRNLLQVVVPVSQLTALADTPGIRLVRLPWYPLPAVVSEGVGLINANEWQTVGYSGAGVQVAILDGGFSGYTTRQSEGELPATVTTWWAPSIGGPGTSDHGTACAEVVYDIAPGADFYLVNFGTSVELGNAVDWLIAQGVDIISFSVGYPIGGPGDGTGTINAIVDTARAAGILWSSSIGNSAQRHWQGDFVDTEPDGWHDFNSGVDETNAIYVNEGEPIIVGLKWDDTWGSSGNNYDLYLLGGIPLDLVAWSTWTQDGNDDPWELLVYIATYTGYYHIAIDGYFATTTANLHLYSYRHDLQYQVASSSFAIPADSPNAMAVGAVFWNNPTTLESFSSQGPTKDGRVKPDLVAPDGVSTATYGTTAFYGTSASAPAVAGAAALVKERYPSYTPAQIQTFLEDRAVELGDAGKDNLYGSGRLHLGASGIIVVTTDNATDITTNSAILHGSLASLGDYSPVNVSFVWGTISGALDQETTPEAMTSPGAFSANLSSLFPNTTYYFRAKATGSVTVYGDELSFTTERVLPAVTTNDATDITISSATLNGNLDDLGAAGTVNVSFEWGLTTSYGSETTPQAMIATGAFSAQIDGLLRNTTYHFRAKAVGNGTSYGEDRSFSTPSWGSMNSGTSNYLAGVWGSSSSDVFAVGGFGTILHYDGSTWSSMSSGTSKSLEGGWGSSGSDVFAIGEAGTILHYDGSTWSPMSSGTSNYLWGVWGSSGSDVFAVGHFGTILHYDGSTWSPMSSGTDKNLYSVWGSSASDVFAVGEAGTILHYDGSTWSSMSSGTSVYLRDVWGSSASDVFAVGDSNIIRHYDGSTWSGISTGTGVFFYGVWDISASDVFAVGEAGTILHYDGSTWSSMNSGSSERLYGLWGSSSSDVFAVGENGTILHYEDTTPPTVGGTIVLVDKLELVMPWVIVAALIVVAGIWLGIWNRRRRIGSPSGR